MTDPTNPDAPAPEATELRSLSDIIGRANDDMHVPEAGASHEQTPAPAPAAAETSAPPAPLAATAEPPTPAPAPQAAPASPAGDEPKSPKWYREHMAQVARDRAAEQRELAELRGRQPPPQTRQDIDPLEDPQGFQQSVAQQFQTFALQQTLTISERFARKEHGAELFEDAKAWLSTKPDIEAWAINQPDPWAAAITHFQREQLAEEIGNDPNAWREAEKARIRAEIEAEMGRDTRHEPAPRPAMNTTTRAAPPPPSSTVRSAAPRDDNGRFAGPAPLKSILKNP
jgi:hypothetical protein